MATRLAALSQNAAADAVTARANGGTVEIRTGSQPATGDTAADMNFNSVSFVAGGTANVTAWTYTHPST
jgi:hypothetical protein